MTPERWQQVNDLFQSVADRPPEERTTFLQTACQGDEALLREVESLIASHESAQNFIETPAFETAPELLTNEQAQARAIVGESIGRYRIESLIGIGGMGEVYLARDEQLGRKVALKFLPERLTTDKMQLSRFKSEARTASALNHPNILTVYEIGTDGDRHFIATEFIEGVTLRALFANGRMSIRHAVEVALQVASALAAAHQAGVVHRDIKPENIMVRPDGYVKVLDFGIAKLTEQHRAADDDGARMTTLLQTHPGLMIGTTRYMSPEQTRGQSADARSDIWSLGVVLYEMVGGIPPFSGGTPSDCIASILQTEPPPLSSVARGVPSELQSIVQKALRKNATERYETIAGMLADLRSLDRKLETETSASKFKTGWPWNAAIAAIVIAGLAALFLVRYRSLPPTARMPALPAQTQIPHKSIAVLPFQNLSRDPDNAFFTDGVQDEILTDLARIADLKVISRTSVMQYKSGAKRNLRQIGNELGVGHVLEGSVQRAGNRVRVNAQLIDARNDAHLWAQTYDRDLADVFAIQSEIAKTIADQLQAKLSPSEKSAIEQPPTTDISAFDLYSHAKNLFLKAFADVNARGDLLQAADLLKQAVARDPSFFQAYCQLAFTEINIYGVLDHNRAYLAEAEAALQSAARLRPDAGETHLARARNLYWGYLDYDGALRELEIARQSLPGEDWIFSLKGYIERRRGRWEESIRNLERATELDPRNVLTLQQLALTYQQLRRYAEEKSTFERILAFEPDDPVTKSQHAFVELDSKADIRPLHEVTNTIRDKNSVALPSVADNWLLCAFAERDPAAASKALIALGENPASLGPIADVGFNRSFMEGLIARLEKDEARAQAAFIAARAEQEKIIQAQSNYGPTVCVLGLIDAALGRKQEALREGRRAVELLPVEKDAPRGIAIVKFLAMIAAWVGDNDLACEQLAIAIHNPSDLSYGQLKLMPFWDSLRGDPRFEKLIEEVKAPVALSASDARSAANLAAAPEKSIAVLPFENLSRDPDNAYFAEGIQDEILTDLARIADLKVISRTSVMQYKSGAKRNLRQIGNELGVAHVLEGSVQRAGNRVRVNAQLIDARNDAHLWAQTYDRDLADVFAIQSEIAKTIADQLQAKLSPNEKSEIEQPPTIEVAAFDFYSHAKNLLLNASGSSTGKADLLQAADLLNQAVARDPAFFEAHCQLAFTHASLYFFDFDRTPSRLAAAEGAVQTAARLRPEAGETHLARARNLYWGHSDYDGALAELEIARQRLPSDNGVLSLKGYIERRQGRWDDSLRDLERAIALDPRNILTLQQTARSYSMLHRYAESKLILARVLSFEPNDPVTKVLHAFVELDSNANARPVHETIDSIRRTNPAAIPNVANNWLLCALAERDVAAARLALAACGENPILLSSNENVIFPHSFAEGLIARTNHDDEKARAAFAAAHAEQEKIVQARATYGPALCVLGLIDAALGRKEQALREGRRAVELVRAEKDAVVGPTTIKYLAIIAAWVGDTDLACNQLTMLIRGPSGVSYGQLKLMPFWDPLRADPRFEKILEEAKEPVAGGLVATNVPAKSIAVLPFENLSRDPDNAYFAEGIQDEILTRLSKIAELKVISRTSTRQYKSATANVPDIAKQLGVAHILEGSVQKSGDAVRVNVQLIKAANDTHVWADTFDRKLTDTFSVESEVAKAIADQLGAKLTGQEEQVIAAKPTNNPEAYDAYLRGLAYSLKPANTTANVLGAQKYLREAVRLDPKFALAWALLSSVDSLGYRTVIIQRTNALREEARQAAETALSLQPNLGEAVLAKGYYYYGCLKDYDTAIRHFEQARQLLPNDSRIAESLAYVTRRRGQWEQSESYFNEAERLDVRNANLLTQHALSYTRLRRFPEALRKLDQVLNITPDDVHIITYKACIAQAQGDLPEAARILAPLRPDADDPGAWETQVYQAILERRPAAIIPRVQQLVDKPDPSLGYLNADLRFWLGWAQEIAGDRAGAQKSWQQARGELESFLKEEPENFNILSDLALTNMGLGDKAAAFAFAERAIAANPLEDDAISGPSSIETLARVAARMGEPDRAIAALEKLLSIPAETDTVVPITPALLRLDPMFDSLRKDPRFQKLVASDESKEN